MSNEFRNAYHFVPRKAPIKQPGFPAAAAFGRTAETAAQGHAIYAEGASSGVLRCTITLEQETVIGAERIKRSTRQTPSTVIPYRFQGELAVPATSIKGLIGGLIEAATLSPYRIVDATKPLTVAWGNQHQWNRRELQPVTDYIPEALRPGSAMGIAGGMLGFVRDGVAADGLLQALAGKLRFTRGRMTNAQTPGAKVRLKELAQPMKNHPLQNSRLRSATPNFYFRERTGASDQAIGKPDFASGGPAKYEVQGAKAYLHHAASTAADRQPWKAQSGPTDRQAEVTPLPPGTQFSFEIRFDNLTDTEFQALCFAIRPSSAFRHKIGMGKPLGLGSVRIDPVGLELVDRAARYRGDDVFAPAVVADHLRDFALAVAAQCKRMQQGEGATTLQALLLIGETHDWGEGETKGRGVDPPVLWVPLTPQKFAARFTAEAEDRSFKWFVDNDLHGKQRLRPIDGDALPTLWTTAPARDRARQAGQGPDRQHGQGQRAAPVPAPHPGDRRAPQAGPVPQRYEGVIRPEQHGRELDVEFSAGGQTQLAVILRRDRQALNLKPGLRIRFDAEPSRQRPGELLARSIARV